MANDVYTSPLASRYASPYMLHLFSPDSRFQTWRRLWVALARAQHQLGLPITARQVQELEAHVTDIDYEVAAARSGRCAMTSWPTSTPTARRPRLRRHPSIWGPPAATSPTTPT